MAEEKIVSAVTPDGSASPSSPAPALAPSPQQVRIDPGAGSLTASAPTAPTPTTVSQKPVAPTRVITKPSLAEAMNKIAAAALPRDVIAKLQKQCRDTSGLTNGWLHAIIYGPTDARRSTSAALFGTPESVRIVLVRNEEQLLPLRKFGYKYVKIETAEQLKTALLYPEAIWPEWANLPDRVLILDDITEGKDLLMEEHEIEVNDKGEEREVFDTRRIVKSTRADIREVIKSVLRKPMHFIIIAGERTYENSHLEERTRPDLPDSINSLITYDFEFCFYVDKSVWKFVTCEQRTTTEKRDEKGRIQTYKRIVVAKHKLPIELEGKGVLMPLETMDLRKLWKKVLEASAPGSPTSALSPAGGSVKPSPRPAAAVPAGQKKR